VVKAPKSPHITPSSVSTLAQE